LVQVGCNKLPHLLNACQSETDSVQSVLILLSETCTSLSQDLTGPSFLETFTQVLRFAHPEGLLTGVTAHIPGTTCIHSNMHLPSWKESKSQIEKKGESCQHSFLGNG